MITGTDIVEFSRSLVGRPYHPGLNVDCDALDCVGVVEAVARHFGIDMPAAASEGRPTSFVRALALAKEWVTFMEEPCPGDFLMMNVGRDTSAEGRVHFGILTDAVLFNPFGLIATNKEVMRVVEQRFDSRYLQHQHRFCRFIGVA